MRSLTVLGSSGGFPTVGQPCSGFLIRWDGFALVLDLGYGTLTQLLAHMPVADIDAVVITHEHPDHCVDLHGLFRIVLHGSIPRRLPLYCPPGVLDRLAGLEPDVDLRDVFDAHPLPGSYAVGPFRLRGVELPHFVLDIGVRLETSDTTIAYTGDTGPDPALTELGRGADLYVVEATDRPGELTRMPRLLLTAAEAGQWAQAANARRLLLTHFWPGNDRAAARQAAGQHFRGDVLIAEPGMEIAL